MYDFFFFGAQKYILFGPHLLAYMDKKTESEKCFKYLCVCSTEKKRKSYRFQWVNDDHFILFYIYIYIFFFFFFFLEWTIPLKIRYTVNRFSVVYNQALNTERSVVNQVYLRWISEHFSLTCPSVCSLRPAFPEKDDEGNETKEKWKTEE